MTDSPRALTITIVRCPLCGLACEHIRVINHAGICPRCQTVLHPRYPDSLSQCWALLITSMILYLPANLLPVMFNSIASNGHENTIMGGIIAFWNAGSQGIALIIFVASILVPCLKFLVMGGLLISVQRQQTRRRAERTHLFRLMEHIGYWSILDVIVVALVAALINIPGLSRAEPRIGILFYGAVVLITLLAALKFDPRLIWDGTHNE